MVVDPGVDQVVLAMAFLGKLVIYLMLCCRALLVSGSETMSVEVKMNPPIVKVSRPSFASVDVQEPL